MNHGLSEPERVIDDVLSLLGGKVGMRVDLSEPAHNPLADSEKSLGISGKPTYVRQDVGSETSDDVPVDRRLKGAVEASEILVFVERGRGERLAGRAVAQQRLTFLMEFADQDVK